jgi:hypothetical protein
MEAMRTKPPAHEEYKIGLRTLPVSKNLPNHVTGAMGYETGYLKK